MTARKSSNASHPPSPDLYRREANRELLVSELGVKRSLGPLRGLMIAIGLAAPIWAIVYLALR